MATEEIVEFKALRAKLQASQEYLLGQVKSKFEEAVSKVVGKECVINIDSGKCRFQIGGVDISGLSDGETLSLIPGIIAGLCATNETKWIPLLVDRFEAISKDRRVDFLKALKSLIEHDSISQVFIAGCPDEVPPMPEKSKVHKLTK